MHHVSAFHSIIADVLMCKQQGTWGLSVSETTYEDTATPPILI